MGSDNKRKFDVSALFVNKVAPDFSHIPGLPPEHWKFSVRPMSKECESADITFDFYMAQGSVFLP